MVILLFAVILERKILVSMVIVEGKHKQNITIPNCESPSKYEWGIVRSIDSKW